VSYLLSALLLSGGLFQNLQTFGQAADYVLYQFGFLHFVVMYRTKTLNQSSVHHTFKPVRRQAKISGSTKPESPLRAGILRARVTQVMNLLQLPAEVQAGLAKAARPAGNPLLQRKEFASATPMSVPFQMKRRSPPDRRVGESER
jgi:hypothetical protein